MPLPLAGSRHLNLPKREARITLTDETSSLSRVDCRNTPSSSYVHISHHSSCSPCKCGACGESPASPASSSTDTSSKASNSISGWPDSIAPPRTEALGSSGSNGSPLAGKPRYRRLARNAAPRRIVFNTPRPPPSSATTAGPAAATATAAAASAEPAEGIEPSEQRNKRGSDRGVPSSLSGGGTGSFPYPFPLPGKSTASSSAASIPSAGAPPASAATPVAVSVNVNVEGEPGARTTFMESGTKVNKPGVAFVKIDAAEVASVCDVNISGNGINRNNNSNNHTSGGLTTAGVTGFEKWRAPPVTVASGIFSVGAPSASSQPAAAVGGRRRRRGG